MVHNKVYYLYDRFDVIPFDRLEVFFWEHLFPDILEVKFYI